MSEVKCNLGVTYIFRCLEECNMTIFFFTLKNLGNVLDASETVDTNRIVDLS